VWVSASSASLSTQGAKDSRGASSMATFHWGCKSCTQTTRSKTWLASERTLGNRIEIRKAHGSQWSATKTTPPTAWSRTPTCLFLHQGPANLRLGNEFRMDVIMSNSRVRLVHAIDSGKDEAGVLANVRGKGVISAMFLTDDIPALRASLPACRERRVYHTCFVLSRHP